MMVLWRRRSLVAPVRWTECPFGCPKVNLQVRAENVGVLAFYQALGYRVEDRVSMGKVLP